MSCAGWPTEWDTKLFPKPVGTATVANAAYYNNKMIYRIKNNLSTPKMRSLATQAPTAYRMPVEAYVFEALDEKNKGDANTPWEKTWGTMYEDATPKYALDWTGNNPSPSPPTSPAPTPAPSSAPIPNVLANGGRLTGGQKLRNPVTTWRLEMQTDCNLVLYDAAAAPKWETKTSIDSGCYVDMQSDCNLVVYKGSPGVVKYASSTSGKGSGCKLVLADDNTLVIRDSAGALIKQLYPVVSGK